MKLPEATGGSLGGGPDMRLKKKAALVSNAARALIAYRRRRATVNHFPSYLWIEPTNRCNLRCVMCPSGAGDVTFGRGFMALSLFRKIVDEIHPRTSTIVLALGGESLLHPGLFEMIRLAAGREVKVHLNTNATLLDREKAEALLASGTSSVSFAFDGFNKRMYEEARRGADFESTLDNILHFLRRKKETGRKRPFTVLSILDLGLGVSSPEEKAAFLRNFDGLIDDIHIRRPHSVGPAFLKRRDFKFEVFDRASGPCGRLWNTLGIAWNGDVLPCTYHMNHEYVLGNVNEMTVAEAWNGPAMVALRTAWLEGRPLGLSPVCENCAVAGSPKILGIPAGLRSSLADCLTNIFGYGFEKKVLRLANVVRKGKFTTRPIRAKG